MARKKREVSVAVVIPDAGPILTLARIGRMDLLATMDAPVHVVDQVLWEVTKPENDPDGNVARALKSLHNRLTVVETAVGLGFQVKRSKDPRFSSRNLGELAVAEYAMQLRSTSGPSFIPLVLFEDPDVLDMPIASMKDVHLLNTTAFVFGLYQADRLPEGLEVIDRINTGRKSDMVPFEKEARTKRIRSQWLRRRSGSES